MTTENVPDFLFKNPMGVSLEKLYITIKKNNGQEEIKALNKFWVTECYYSHFPPIPETDNNEDRKKWPERADNYIKGLKFVIHKLPFYKFWSHILYDTKILEMLDSFLRYAVPCYLPQPSAEFVEPYFEIYSLVFQVFQKIFTPKQSETEFITPTVLGTLLRDNNVITNYTLWDLCKLYGHTDDGTLQNLLKFAYEIIPDIKEELQISVICMSEIFESIGTVAYEEEAPTEKLVNRLTNLLYDTAFSINMFFKMYPPYKSICISASLFSRILHTYDSEVPIVYHLMKQVYINDNDPGYETVDNARVELLEISHQLLSYCMDMILQAQENNQEQNKWIEIYFNLITSIIDSHVFLTDYNRVYPIGQDVEMLTNICPEVDKQKCSKILEAVNLHKIEDETEQLKEQEQLLVNGFEDLNLETEATIPENILLESKITELVDVFPNYGDGFLEQCLLEMNMDTQAVIMSILEGNLSPHLSELDKTLPRIPDEEPEEELPLEAAYIGKKPSEYGELSELLNDKTHVNEQRLRFQLYSSTTDDDIYDDDYDERCGNDYTVSMDFDDKEEICKPSRRGGTIDSEEEYGSTDENMENGKQNKEDNGRADQFCEDPAAIRARREERLQQLRGKSGPSNGKTRPKDVVGQPKGQGQEKDVQKNRDKKNTHKSSRANHNRRSGAQWKRSRGMIPS